MLLLVLVGVGEVLLNVLWVFVLVVNVGFGFLCSLVVVFVLVLCVVFWCGVRLKLKWYLLIFDGLVGIGGGIGVSIVVLVLWLFRLKLFSGVCLVLGIEVLMLVNSG